MVARATTINLRPENVGRQFPPLQRWELGANLLCANSMSLDFFAVSRSSERAYLPQSLSTICGQSYGATVMVRLSCCVAASPIPLATALQLSTPPTNLFSTRAPAIETPSVGGATSRSAKKLQYWRAFCCLLPVATTEGLSSSSYWSKIHSGRTLRPQRVSANSGSMPRPSSLLS